MVTEMNKITICTILLALLMGMTSIFAGSVNAQTGIVSIQFKGQADGKCFAGIAEPIPGDGPGYFESYGIGRGQAQIKGTAQAYYLFDIPIVGSIYESTSLSASASVSFSWVEEDGTKHSIQAQLYSDGSTAGGFAPSSDVFSVPAPPQPEPPLKFQGEHTITNVHSTERTQLSGIALYGSVPADPNYGLLRMIRVYLGDEASQRFYVAEWVSEQALVQLPYNGASITVPACGSLESKVKITAWDSDYYFKATFKASTKGDCVVVCNARETTSDYLTLGKGEFSLQGKAVAELSQYSLPPDSIPLFDVVPGTMEASGKFQASWTDNEGNPYYLQIEMSPSLNYPYSQLEPNRDYMIFSATILSQGLRMAFDYTGTLKRGSETFNVQGKCGFMVVPVTYFTPPSEVNPPDSDGLFFFIQTFWGGKSNGYHFGCADRDTHVMLGGYDLHLPAAKTFKHEVIVSNP